MDKSPGALLLRRFEAAKAVIIAVVVLYAADIPPNRACFEKVVNFEQAFIAHILTFPKLFSSHPTFWLRGENLGDLHH